MAGSSLNELKRSINSAGSRIGLLRVPGGVLGLMNEANVRTRQTVSFSISLGSLFSFFLAGLEISLNDCAHPKTNWSPNAMKEKYTF